MSAITSELYQAPDSQPYQPTVAELHKLFIDDQNANDEERQLSKIEPHTLAHEGRQFRITTYQPTAGLRTWTNEQGIKVKYPELLMVHGVASDERYFDNLFKKMNKLGIACSAIELPREHHVITDGFALLDWQSGAMNTAQEYLQEQHHNNHIVLGGHSRGAIVSVMAAEKQVRAKGLESIDGVLLLAPSVEPKSLGRVALNLFGLAYNSLKHSRDMRLVGSYALMIAEVVAANAQQSIVETKQALTMNVKNIMYDELSDVSIFIPAAENDEFVDHKALMKMSEYAPAGNIPVVTLNTNHMLGECEQPDVYSLADQRLLSGQILAWLQSLTSAYRPLSIRNSDGNIVRL